VEEFDYISAPRAAREDLLADLESSLNYVYWEGCRIE
jgi:hypothetical protein